MLARKVTGWVFLSPGGTPCRAGLPTLLSLGMLVLMPPRLLHHAWHSSLYIHGSLRHRTTTSYDRLHPHRLHYFEFDGPGVCTNDTCAVPGLGSRYLRELEQLAAFREASAGRLPTSVW